MQFVLCGLYLWLSIPAHNCGESLLDHEVEASQPVGNLELVSLPSTTRPLRGRLQLLIVRRCSSQASQHAWLLPLMGFDCLLLQSLHMRLTAITIELPRLPIESAISSFTIANIMRTILHRIKDISVQRRM